LILGLAALSGLFTWNGLAIEWDSARLMLAVLAGVSAAAGVLVLLPRVLRRVIISLVVLVHFGGILTAVTNVPPTPWLTEYLWANFYRPYLQLVYLNNAYHFYSPEPGAPNILWFYVKYDDGTSEWRKVPDWDRQPLALEYQRRLSVAEYASQTNPPGADFGLRTLHRKDAGEHDHIPVLQGVVEFAQFSQPNFYSKLMLESYARHVWATSDPAKQVVGVKIYRVIHNFPNAKQIAEGFDPADPSTYAAFYQGAYDRDGKLLDANDPYLYWLIPIVYESTGGSEHVLRNYVERHAKLSVQSDERDFAPIPSAQPSH
jgi:hypothetical protein